MSDCTTCLPRSQGVDRVRRGLMLGAGLSWLVPVSALQAASFTKTRAVPVSLDQVRLKPSIFADAVAVNNRYLLSLDPERLLHNFYLSAGLPAPAPVYGGWEGRGIAGHSLGHWLSAVSIAIANGGEPALATRLDHALAEMARIQVAHGDGYLGGTTVDRDGKTVDGKIIFEEVRRGDIRSQGFDLNGGWVPLYTWHKVHAGLIDAHRLAGNRRALPILEGVSAYLAGVLEPLSDEQMQRVLHAEHGGLNESYADVYAITGNPRWLRMAEKIRHKAVLDPLAAGRDQLAGLHANTQIPKVIGLARLNEVAGRTADGDTARFFHRIVTQDHSYVIGGNSEREHFGPPRRIATALTEATCEACNSYNMMKLTRMLYSWAPQADLFDYYERVQLNHIMAHQRPSDGAFVYFMPLESGARRSFSTAEESFWCCVGSGMESHAKHADSIYWQDGRTLYVNLFVPSTLDWTEGKLALDLDTRFPMDGAVVITIRKAPRTATPIALRLPGWASNPVVTVDGKAAEFERRDGYAVLTRRWRAGETIGLALDMPLVAEATPDDPSLVAFRSGPLVLAADLGPADAPFAGASPVMVAAGDPVAALQPVADMPHGYRLVGASGAATTLRPFFNQYDRRTAVYLPVFTPDRWASERAAYSAAEEARMALAKRTVDTIFLGEMQPERDHEFAASRSEAIQLNGRGARKLEAGEHLTLTLKRPEGGAVLRATYWGWDIDRTATFAVDGKTIATETRAGPGKPGFVTADYPLPAGVGASVAVRVDGVKGDTILYELRMMRAD